MIISEKWKYLFVGLPFSASSAISKELVECYDGRPVLWKHANITDFIAERGNHSGYFCFAVYRDPLEITFSHYNKILTNAYGEFTNHKYFAENGGWVSKRVRRIFHEVRNHDLSFDEYLKLSYKVPYDSVYSLNSKHMDCIIDFTDLNNSFLRALEQTGITPVRDLQVLNKTKKPASMYVKDETFQKVFAPFLQFNKIEAHVKASFYDNLLYRAAQPAKFWMWKKADRAKQARAKESYAFIDGKAVL